MENNIGFPEQDHTMNCFMCLYGNRGFDRLNQTHRDQISIIFNAAINESILSDDEIGTQLWCYYVNVAIPEMQEEAEKEGRNFAPPPWSLQEARRHVHKIQHPTLVLRRMISEICAQKAMLFPHAFPEKQNDDGEWVQTYDRYSNDLLIKLRNQLLSVMSRDPSKMLGGKDTEITTRALTGLWKDGQSGIRNYTLGEDWDIDE